MKFRFIEDARGAWKFLSVNVAAIWAMIVGIIAADPMLFVTAWNAIPAELRDFLPPWVRWLVAASAMFGTIYLARVVKQPITKKGEIAEAEKSIKEVLPDMPPQQLKVAATRMVELQEAAEAEKKAV
jgi:hypothetical protein